MASFYKDQILLQEEEREERTFHVYRQHVQRPCGGSMTGMTVSEVGVG